MGKRYIAEMSAGESIESEVFLISSKDLRTTTNGSLYIHAVLADRTGQMPARMWQASEILYNTLPEGGFVELKGRTESYKGNMQFIIDAIRPVDQDGVNPADFLRTTEHDIDAMWDSLLAILRTVENKHLQLLIKQFVTDEQFVTRFKRSPAAATMHHAYIGGLLEHTLRLLEIAQLVIPRYPRGQPGPGADRAVPARRGQNRGAELRHGVQLQRRGAVDRAYQSGGQLDRAKGGDGGG
jgi:3'-5' exoribonuclease